MTGAVYTKATLTIAVSGTYSTELNFAPYSLLSVKVETAGTLQGTRLCVQGRLDPDDTFANIAPELASIETEFAEDIWLPFCKDTSVGAAFLPFLRFYMDNGSGTPAAQTAAVTITVSLKNVSE